MFKNNKEYSVDNTQAGDIRPLTHSLQAADQQTCALTPEVH